MHAPEPFRRQLLDALPRLRRYARTLVHDSAGVDDLVQGTIERALSHWHQFDQRRDLLVWLLSIAHNAHHDALRRDRRWQGLPPDELAQLQDAQAHHGPRDPGLRIDLLAAFAQLAPLHREVLLLVGVEQLSYAECAEVLQVPAGTVMSRLSRARAALRQALDGAPPARPPVPLKRVV
ncbi:sigma-70 family RNA polymerase sigma factor [Ideonella alba]|uniref:Sigma-70 family RNA polymerase sigma factor n=1 Tax=Ideonella alba TaxID=2824118 RepID=A0A941BKJ1_9BURK|nr:sigma-70 family RNA polymerase sigma factor [Ideonella alba]MBQ0930184.1 sigma-70 family RNA polymerase sigma factor [Ideonella alba]